MLLSLPLYNNKEVCLWMLLMLAAAVHFVKCEGEDFDNVHFTNSWAVHIENGNHKIANKIAEKHGFINYGQIGSLPGYFHFVRTKKEARRHRREVEKTVTLLSEEKIKWVEQQKVLERDKRSIVPEYVPAIHPTGYSVQDPLYNDQWYLNNVGQSSGPSNLDINVLPVWSRGISGKNVVVAILDDGLDHTHPDLRKNYDPTASYDFNDYDEDPMPRDSDPNNCHGTKCAGEVAAEAGNGVCGVGVAFNSSIAGIRMLDGNVTDTIEGGALSYKKDYIDIYSCAWGPKDDGKRFGRPGTLASKALELGVREGRNSLGSIFIWATGNGGLTDDDCNCDGYTTSVYTVSIGAISDHGLSTYYTESCASTLAVTYSGGSHREKKENKIITTTLNHKCSSEFKGTSSAAPLAAGMVALMLEANGNLTWRDVQHIIVETSLMTSPLDEGWRRNGAGKWFNQKFGFGRMDASAMVDKALKWTNVNSQRGCWSDTAVGPWNIPSSGTIVVSMNTSACADTGSAIKSLEHVQVILTLRHRHRGHVSIELISPSGTRTRLLKTRRNDKSTKGLKDWIFMSVHFWGEDPRGTWTLAVTDNSNNNRQHHRVKSRYGDLEDATQILQDDIDGKRPAGGDQQSSEGTDDNPYKTAEEFEINIFKDDSFRKKSKKRKQSSNPKADQEIVPSASNTDENMLKASNTAEKVLKKLKERKLFSKLRENVNAKRLKEKLRKQRLKKKKEQFNSNNNNSNKNKEPEIDGDESLEEKVLEEILKQVDVESTSVDENGSIKPTEKSTGSFKTNTTTTTTESVTEKPNFIETTTLKPTDSHVHAHNTTAEVIPPPPHHSEIVNSTGLDGTTGSVSSKHNTSTVESTPNSNTINEVMTMMNSSEDSTRSSESRMLENLLRNVISQVFGNFLSEKDGVKSFEERISALEALLGKNGTNSDLDPITSSLQNAFKSGRAIDRVNNVLSVLERGKNETKLANTSFSRNANVVIDVLKVLKDVLSTEKDNKNLKGYKQRISSLLEAQTETTNELTNKLLNDLKPSPNNGSNESNSGIVDDALALISQIFEDRQKSGEVAKKNYHVTFDRPDNDIELPDASAAEESPKEITTTRSSKEIQRDNGDGIEKITVERTNVKKTKKPKNIKKKSDTKKMGATFKEYSSLEDDESNDINEFPGATLVRIADNAIGEKPGVNSAKKDSFTITIMKDGHGKTSTEDIDGETSPRPSANMFDTTTTRKKLEPEFSTPTVAQKKMEPTKPSDGNIDIEVLVDGKPENLKSGTIDLSHVVETLNSKRMTEHKGAAKTHHAQRHGTQLKNVNLRLNEDLMPKSLSYDPAKKKTLVHGSPKARNTKQKKTRKNNKPGTTHHEKQSDFDSDDDAFSYFQFNDPMSPIPIIPDDDSEAFLPTFDENSLMPSVFFDTSPTDEEEKASLYDFQSKNENGFEASSLKSQQYDVEKRSRLNYPNNYDVRKQKQNQESDLPELLSDLIHARRRRSHDDDEIDIEDVEFDREITNSRHPRSTTTAEEDSLPFATMSTSESRQHVRRRRSLETTDDKEPTLYRQKRNIIDEDDDGENGDDDDEGPHVVKRSAIFSELYPSRQPIVSSNLKNNDNSDNGSDSVDDSNEDDEDDNKNINKNDDIPKKSNFEMIIDDFTSPTILPSIKNAVSINNDNTNSNTTTTLSSQNIAKRSAVKKALSLEGTLQRKLVSMRKESSTVLDIIKRVHNDITRGDSKDLRILEKELSKLESSSSLSSSSRSSIQTIQRRKSEEPLVKLIKLMEQSENSGVRDDVVQVGPGETSDDGKQNPDEYYKYGTATSGILVNWTLKFYGTG